MWFATGASSFNELSLHQKGLYVQYLQMESYIDSLSLQDNLHQGLNSIEVYINYDGGEVYFEYPSTPHEKFKDVNTPLYNYYFNSTISHYLLTSQLQSIFVYGNEIKSCSPTLDRDDPFGVICLNLDIYMLTSTITSALNVPDFELSTSEYYLVKPVDTESGQKFPQIIATFNSKNLESIKMPKSQYFTDVTQDVDELFGKNRNYSLNVQQLNFTKNYYIMPVTTYNVNDKN